MLSLIVFHQSAVQLGVRKMSVDMILFDFEAIADEFGGFAQLCCHQTDQLAYVGQR
jgi:hypothetical protein